MEWEFTLQVAGETLLANAPYGAPRDTNFAVATLWRETPPRLAIAPREENLPEADAPREVQMVEDWLAALAVADIRLRGEPATLHCTVTVDDAALPAEEERNAFL